MKCCLGIVKKDRHSRSSAFDHLAAEGLEESLDVPPLDVRRQGIGEDRRQRPLMFFGHDIFQYLCVAMSDSEETVPGVGTEFKQKAQVVDNRLLSHAHFGLLKKKKAPPP